MECCRGQVHDEGFEPAGSAQALFERTLLGRWTLIEAWASMKGFVLEGGSEDPADGGRNSARDFLGKKSFNGTHASTTDPDAWLFRKCPGKKGKLCHMGYITMENRPRTARRRGPQSHPHSENPYHSRMNPFELNNKPQNCSNLLATWRYVPTINYNLFQKKSASNRLFQQSAVQSRAKLAANGNQGWLGLTV